MKNKENELKELIRTKESEAKELRDQLFELIKKTEESELKEKYLGKYFLHKEFDDKWFTYIYVNNLDEYNNLHSFTFTFCYNEKKR